MARVNNINCLLASIVIYSLISYLFSLPGWLTGIVFAIIGSQISIILPGEYKSSLVFTIPLIIAAYWYPIIFFTCLYWFCVQFTYCIIV